VKLGIGKLPKHHGMRESITYLLHLPSYTHIGSQFKNIFHISDLPNLQSHQNYGELGTLLSMLFEHRNAILKKLK
jgi:hypothetical protein